MCMKIEKSLEQIGLTKNEIQVYLYLVNRGVATGNEIYVDNDLDKSSAYRALDNLEKLKLVYAIGQSRNQKFYADNGANLLKLQKEKEDEIAHVRLDIVDFVNNIEKNSKSAYKKSNVEIFEGKEEYKRFMNERLKPGVKLIRDLARLDTTVYFIDDYTSFMTDYKESRISKKIMYHGLFDSTALGQVTDKSSEANYKEVRILNESLDLKNAVLTTFGNKTGIYTERGGKFWGIIISDVIVTSLVNSLFDFIWNRATVK